MERESVDLKANVSILSDQFRRNPEIVVGLAVQYEAALAVDGGFLDKIYPNQEIKPEWIADLTRALALWANENGMSTQADHLEQYLLLKYRYSKSDSQFNTPYKGPKPSKREPSKRELDTARDKARSAAIRIGDKNKGASENQLRDGPRGRVRPAADDEDREADHRPIGLYH